MLKITGKYKRDNNFTNVYCSNKVYVIANNTGDWSSLSVGDRILTGQVITQEIYDEWVSECEMEGTFELSCDIE